jgi:hypothetical protein
MVSLMTLSTAPTRSRYLTTTETAKLVRAALREAFPDGRFSVRSSYYSGGSSIHVSYVDGPSREKVDAVVDRFSGRGFDGSIDLSYYIDAYVLDGKVVGTKTSGTQGSLGYVPAHDDAVPGAELVSLGGGYLSVTREFSPDAAARRDAFIRERYDVTEAHYAPPGAYRTADEVLGDLPFGSPK